MDRSAPCQRRDRAHGRPKPGEIPAGDRLRYAADEGPTSARAHGRPKPGEIPAGDRLRYAADEGRA